VPSATRIIDIAPKTQKNVPNQGATMVFSASPSALMNARFAYPDEMFWPNTVE